MLGLVGLVVLSELGAASVPPPTLGVPALQLSALAAAAPGAPMQLRLPRLDEVDRAERSAQRRRSRSRSRPRSRDSEPASASGTTSEGSGDAAGEASTEAGATAATPESTAEGTSMPTDAETSEAAAGVAGEETAEEEAEPDIELLRHRAQITRTHRVLGITTWASLGATVALGTFAAINRPTLFGEGQCNSADGYNVFGDFGCNGGLTAAHLISSFVTVGLYTTTGIFALSMPDPERAGAAQDQRGNTLRLHRTLAWVHAAGMLLTPLLGIVSVIPNVIGVSPGAQSDFSSAMRTVHLGVGYVTFAALTAAMIVEL